MPAAKEGWDSVSRPPTSRERFVDLFFRGLTYVAAGLTVALILYIVITICSAAAPAIGRHGLAFLTETAWDPNKGKYGILPEIWGTLYSSVLALVIGTVLGLAVAVFLSERMMTELVIRLMGFLRLPDSGRWAKVPDVLESLLKNLIGLLAAIPSVVYGLWGIFVIIPLIRPACNWIHQTFGWIPFFSSELSGPGMLPAAIVLAIMILPTISAISCDALVSVPNRLRSAAYGLGATRWEALLTVIIPTARTGIMGAILLAFGRALGETMALAMLVGNANVIKVSLFSPANTLAALLANTFPEAQKDQVGVLMYAALVLMGITLVVNIIGALILRRGTPRKEA
jgi:phosphate transport system permease protein